jgi:hypothetical protein
MTALFEWKTDCLTELVLNSVPWILPREQFYGKGLVQKE